MTDVGAWHGGVIAAGDGLRLRQGGWAGSKAMAPVGGRPLLAHALDRFRLAGFRKVTVIINEASPDCRGWLETLDHGLELDLVVRTTPSSFASFEILAQRLAGERTVITTVDSVLPARDFTRFITQVAQLPSEAIGLAVTGYVDDEKPLWADLDQRDGRIRQLGGTPTAYVTAGLYALPGRMPARVGPGFERLRDYLGWLVTHGPPTYGLVIPLVFDVDRPGDVVHAERALSVWNGGGEERWD